MVALSSCVDACMQAGNSLADPRWTQQITYGCSEQLGECLHAGGQFTGGSALDSARAFATSVVFNCSWRWTGM